jgi:hypothetical protein
MGRCEALYLTESRRCDRQATAQATVADGERYELCAYHLGHPRASAAARWAGDSERRTSQPVGLSARRAQAA